jgi:hypothetical protein
VAGQTAPVVKASVTYADRLVGGTPPIPASGLPPVLQARSRAYS